MVRVALLPAVSFSPIAVFLLDLWVFLFLLLYAVPVRLYGYSYMFAFILILLFHAYKLTGIKFGCHLSSKSGLK